MDRFSFFVKARAYSREHAKFTYSLINDTSVFNIQNALTTQSIDETPGISKLLIHFLLPDRELGDTYLDINAQYVSASRYMKAYTRWNLKLQQL